MKTIKLKASEKQVKENPLYAKLLSFEPRRRDVRKALIIESAISCIGKDGIENTHFESIGKRSGMGRAHVKYYFKDRNAIVKAAIEFVATTAQMITLECLSRSQSPKERLEAYINGSFIWAKRYPEHLVVMGLSYYYCAYDDEYKKLNTEIRRLGAERILSVLNEMKLKKKDDEVLIKLAKGIQNLILGHLVDWGSTKNQMKLDEIQEDVTKQVWSLIS